jgi:hypothetical protein
MLFMLLLPAQVLGGVYYLSTSGDDSNDGVSESTPWRSIFKLNRTAFSPGDVILFKRGDIWDGSDAAPIIPLTSGTAAAPIMWGAYGTGKNPVITYAARRNSPDDWTFEGNNIWSTGGIALTGAELFPNPDFALNDEGWYFQCSGGGANCSFAGRTEEDGGYDTTPGGYKFGVLDHGTRVGDVQLYTAGRFPLSFIQGRYYIITFRAKSSVAFTIPDILLRSGGEDITSGMFVKAFDVGRDWTTCSYIFRADSTTATGMFNLLLGGSSGIPNGAVFYADTFSCREIEDEDFFGMYHSANLIFNYSSGFPLTGRLVQSGNLVQQGDWYQSFIDRKIRLYSKSNPAIYYNGDILVVSGSPKSGFYVGGKNHHIFQHFDFFALPSGWHGFDISDMIIQHCNSYVTGGDLMIDRYDYNWGSGADAVRKGQGVGATGNITNWVVRYNHFSNAYDANVTWQNSHDGKIADGIWVYYNIIGSAHYNIEFWWRGAGSSMSNVYVLNNTLYDSGSEWSANQRTDEPVEIHDAHIACYGSPANGSNINIINNIIYGGKSQMIRFSDWSQWSSILKMNNNLYYGKPDHFAKVSGEHYDTLNAWKKISGRDKDSLYGNPRFLSPEDGDYRLRAGSPARNAGQNVGLIADFSGNIPDFKAPDIGAYEYDPAVIPNYSGSGGGGGGGCSVRPRQFGSAAFADILLLFLPLLIIFILKLRKQV